MIDLTFNNPRIKSYFDDTTSVIPSEEILEAFRQPTKEGTFMETIDVELTRAVTQAKKKSMRLRSDLITNQLLVLTRCHIAFVEGEPAEKWVPLAANAFKTMWLQAKKVNDK